MATIQELLELREEVASKQAQVAEMEADVVALQEELAELKGEIPTYACPYCEAVLDSKADLDAHIAAEHPIAAEIVPWYKKWQTYLLLGGVGTLITGIAGIAIKKKLAKK